MKGPAQQSKQLTLGDVAYVYQGIGTRDLKLGQEPGEGFVACWAVGASAIDGTASKLNRSHYVRAAISKRLVDNPLRGSGQMAKLQSQEILIANRGNYKISSLVGLTDSLEWYHEYMPVYPAATILVVRPKKKYEWPWRLLAFLDSPQVREQLLNSASGSDGEGRVITKADLEGLVLPPNYHTLAEQFHTKSRENLERLEELDSRLSKLRRAETQAKIWRELHAPQQHFEYPWLVHELEEKIPGLAAVQSEHETASRVYAENLEGSDKKEEARNEVMRLRELGNNLVRDFTLEIFSAIRRGDDFSDEQRFFCEAFKVAHGLDLKWESMREVPLIGRILAEPVDSLFSVSDHNGLRSSTAMMTPGVMDLIGSISCKFKSVAVLNPGAGHLPAAIASKDGPTVTIFPLKTSGGVLLPFAKAYAEAVLNKQVLTCESAEDFLVAAHRRRDFQGRRDAIVLNAGMLNHPPRSFNETLDKISPGIERNGVCLAFVPADRLAWITGLLDRILSYTVLPPLPKNPREPKKHGLSQGFIVEIAMNGLVPRTVVPIFDATGIVSLDQVGADLNPQAITTIAKAINDDTSVPGVDRFTVKREVFVKMKEWPGLIALRGISYDHLKTVTVETLHDERARLIREKSELEKELESQDDAGLVFRRIKEASDAQSE
jgi:hypothetical protein